MVHRDLKPSNVLLSPQGPRVIDFGIARAADATAITRTGVRLGTPAWMAPEQVRGEEAGPPADVFAWGALVAFAGTGRPPFEAETPEAVAYQIVHDDPDLEGLEPWLLGLVQRAMSKDPAGRPTSLQLVRSLLGDETVPDDDAGVGTSVRTELAKTWDVALVGPAAAYRAPSRSSTRRRILVGTALSTAIAVIGTGAAIGLGGSADVGRGQEATSPAAGAIPTGGGVGAAGPGGSSVPTPEPFEGPDAGARASTSERIFDAFTATGELEPSFTVRRTTDGSCVGSFVGRPDAWRCFAGDFVYDPCFQPPRASREVVCDLTPWDLVGVRVRLESALPWPESLSRKGWLRKPPWAVELLDGTRCLLILGGAGREMVGGEAVNYTCEPGGGLWGEPDDSSDPWTVYFVSPDGGEPTKVEGAHGLALTTVARKLWLILRGSLLLINRSTPHARGEDVTVAVHFLAVMGAPP
ncbi:MAG: hypothetical protein KatS3mg014_0704 [Actinomycetota bacterium]|nr:MAG: hypothetical protein KatS3mg014_0704 [Actinomycetota bacterium]